MISVESGNEIRLSSDCPHVSGKLSEVWNRKAEPNFAVDTYEFA
jgi:hypothetical protein